LDVGGGANNFWDAGGSAHAWDRGVTVPPRNMLVPHVCYHSKFCRWIGQTVWAWVLPIPKNLGTLGRPLGMGTWLTP